jgi:PST family polysaccharide transporter
MIFRAVDVIDYWFQAQVQGRYSAVARTLAFSVMALVKLGLIFADASIAAFAWATCAEAAVASLLLAGVYGRSRERLRRWRVRREWIGPLLRDGFPLMLSGAAVAVCMRTDQVMLKHMSGDASVGIYAAAQHLSELGLLLSVIIAQSVFPFLLTSRLASPSLFENKLRIFCSVMVWLSLLLIGGAYLSGETVIGWLYSEDYAASGAILKIHSLMLFFAFFGIVRNRYFVAVGMVRYSFFVILTRAILNIVGNLMLIPRFGAAGAAAGAVVGLFAAECVLPCFYRADRLNAVYLITALVKPFVAMCKSGNTR